MELKHQLSEQLRHLRLSGVLETMEARNRQAIDGQWSYVEFLSRLLEDEVERRSQKQLNLRLRRGAPLHVHADADGEGDADDGQHEPRRALPLHGRVGLMSASVSST